MELDNVTICYQGIQRIYRNAVVGKLRDVLIAAYGAKAIEELKKPFKREWEEIKAAAAERRNTGELANPVKDDFDLLGVNHFYNLFDAQFAVLCPAHGSKPPKEVSQAKQALLGWAKTIKNFRDPLSHPAEIDFDDDDAGNMLYCARKILDVLQLPEAAQKLIELQRQIDEHARAGVNLVYLPPADEVVTRFVGRETETSQLEQWLADPLSRRWALAGDGGKGKSAIAYHFARRIAGRPPVGIDAVIWLSAKRRRFVQGQTLVVDRPDFNDLPSAAAAIIAAYGFVPEDPDDATKMQAQALELLQEFPSLLVIDDIDTLEGTAIGATQFLIMDVPAKTKSKVLMTSRRVLFGLDNCTTAVTGLAEADAYEFVDSRCTVMGLPREATLKHIKSIREVTDSSPLFIEDLLRLTLAGLGVPNAIGLWRDKRGTAAREYAIQREFEKLPDDSKEVLFALSLMDRPCTLDELRIALNWHIDRLVDAQQSLRQMFLMPNISQKDGISKLTLNNNTKLLINKVFEQSAAYARTKRTVQAALGQLETTFHEEAVIDRAVRQVRAVIGRVHREDADAQQHFEMAESTLKRLEAQYPGRADIFSTLGWVYKRAARHTDAREMFKRAVELQCKEHEVFWHWSELESSANEWDAAIKVAETGRTKFPSENGLLYCLGYAQTRAGRELMRNGQVAKGKELCLQAEKNLLDFLEAPVERTALQTARALRALVLNADALGDGKSVNRYLIRWRHKYRDDNWWETEHARMRTKYPGDVLRSDEIPPEPPSAPRRDGNGSDRPQ